MLAAVLLTSSLAVTARAAPLVVPGVYEPDDSNTDSHLTPAALAVPVAYFAGRIFSEMPFSRAGVPLSTRPPPEPELIPKLSPKPSPPPPIVRSQPPTSQGPPPLKPKPVQSVSISLIRNKPKVRSPLSPDKVNPGGGRRIDWDYVEKTATSSEVGLTQQQFRPLRNFLNSLLHNDHHITDNDWKDFYDLAHQTGATDTKLKKVMLGHLWKEVQAAKVPRMDSDAGE